jgi:hypothetical protein
MSSDRDTQGYVKQVRLPSPGPPHANIRSKLWFPDTMRASRVLNGWKPDIRTTSKRITDLAFIRVEALPSPMKAAVVIRFGSRWSIEVRELPKPEPGLGEVRVAECQSL